MTRRKQKIILLTDTPDEEVKTITTSTNHLEKLPVTENDLKCKTPLPAMSTGKHVASNTNIQMGLESSMKTKGKLLIPGAHITKNVKVAKKIHTDDASIISKYKLENAFAFAIGGNCLDHYSTVMCFKAASERLNSKEKKQVRDFIESKVQVFGEHDMHEVYQESLKFF